MNLAPEIFYGIGAVLVGLAIIYAVLRNKGQSRVSKRLGEKATHERYHHSEKAYRETIRPKIKEQLRK